MHSLDGRTLIRSVVFFVVKWAVVAALPLLVFRGLWVLAQPEAPSSPARSTATDPLPVRSSSKASPTESRLQPGNGVKVRVLNGTPTSGVGTALAKRLEEAGFKVVFPAKRAVRSYDRTVVFYQSGGRTGAELVASLVGTTNVQAAPVSVTLNRAIPVTVVIGGDYRPLPSAQAASTFGGTMTVSRGADEQKVGEVPV